MAVDFYYGNYCHSGGPKNLSTQVTLESDAEGRTFEVHSWNVDLLFLASTVDGLDSLGKTVEAELASDGGHLKLVSGAAVLMEMATAWHSPARVVDYRWERTAANWSRARLLRVTFEGVRALAAGEVLSSDYSTVLSYDSLGRAAIGVKGSFALKGSSSARAEFDAGNVVPEIEYPPGVFVREIKSADFDAADSECAYEILYREIPRALPKDVSSGYVSTTTRRTGIVDVVIISGRYTGPGALSAAGSAAPNAAFFESELTEHPDEEAVSFTYRYSTGPVSEIAESPEKRSEVVEYRSARRTTAVHEIVGDHPPVIEETSRKPASLIQHGVVVSRTGFHVPGPVLSDGVFSSRPFVSRSVDEKGFYTVRYRFEWELAEDIAAPEPDLF